jgi:hypothetical protein
VVGGPTGALYGFEIGVGVGTIISPTRLPGQTGPRLTDHNTTTATIGDPLAIGWGTIAVNGTVMWLDTVVEHSQTTTSGGKGTPTQDTTTFSYTQSIAVGLARGPAVDLLRVWENGQLVYDKRPQQDDESDELYAKRVQYTAQYAATFTFYLGTEDQTADPTIELDQGVGNVPPFLGLCYIVYPDRALREDQALRHPQWKFEIIMAGTVGQSVLRPTFLPGASTSVDNATIAVDWARGRYYTISLPLGDTPSVQAWTIENNTQITDSLYTNYSPPLDSIGLVGLGDAIAVNPYTGIPYVAYAGFPTYGGILQLDPITLAQTGGIGPIHDFYSGWNNVAFGQTTDYTGSLVNVMLVVGNVYKNHILTISLNTLSVAAEFIFTGTKVRFCPGRKENKVLVWWIADWTETLSGSGGDIEWTKLTYTPAASPLDLEFWSEAATAPETTHPADIDPTWTHIAEVTNLCFDSTDQHVIFSVVGGNAISSTQDRLVKVNPNTGAVIWAVAYTALSSADIGANGGLITNGKMYAPTTSGADIINTADGSYVHVDLTAALIAQGMSGSLSEAFVANTPVGGGIVTMSSSGPYVLYLAKATGEDILVSQIVHEICDLATLTENDVSTMDGTTVHGYALQTTTVSGRDAIMPLQQVAFFDAVEHGQSLRFVTRGGAPVVTLTQADLGAYDTTQDNASTDPAANNTSVDTLETDLPMQIRLRYSSVERDYQDGDQLSLARFDTDATQVVDVSVAVFLNDNQAAQIAEILWNQAWQRRRNFTFALDMSMTKLEPSDPILVPLKNTLMRAMITQIDDASQILRTVTAVSDDDGAYVSSAVAAPVPPPLTMVFYADSQLFMLDVPLLRDRDDTARLTAPLYSAVAPNSTDVWRGAQILNSPDGVQFTGVNQTNIKADMGSATSTLADVANPYVTDITNSLTVKFDDGATLPSSITSTALFAGGNAAALVDAGGSVEVIQFRDVTPVSAQTVTLSHLLRGRRGTDTMTGSHASGSRLVILTTAQLELTNLDLVQLDNTLFWKAVTFSPSALDATAQSFTSVGRSLMPYAPVNLHALPSGSPTTDIEIHGKRRARIGASEWLDGETDDLPLAEDFERYEMDVYSGSTILRTITASSLPVVYEHADIITDFGSIPESVKIALYQISHQVGRGFGRIETLELE